MTAIVVAIIGFLGTLGAAALPKLIELWSKDSALRKTAPVPFAATAVFAVFSLVAVWGAVASVQSGEFFSPLPAIFFVAVAGVSAALYGYGSLSCSQTLGAYVGYISAAIAATFLLWWPIGSWTSLWLDGRFLANANSNYTPQTLYALAHSLALALALRAHVRSIISLGRARQAAKEHFERTTSGS